MQCTFQLRLPQLCAALGKVCTRKFQDGSSWSRDPGGRHSTAQGWQCAVWGHTSSYMYAGTLRTKTAGHWSTKLLRYKHRGTYTRSHRPNCTHGNLYKRKPLGRQIPPVHTEHHPNIGTHTTNTYTCTHTYIHKIILYTTYYTQTYICILIHIRMYIHTCTEYYTHTHIHIKMYVSMYIYVCTCQTSKLVLKHMIETKRCDWPTYTWACIHTCTYVRMYIAQKAKTFGIYRRKTQYDWLCPVWGLIWQESLTLKRVHSIDLINHNGWVTPFCPLFKNNQHE